MTRDSYIPPVVLDHMEARTDDPAALAEIARLRAEQTIYRYDPQPVNWQDETQLWEKLRTEGGNVVDAEGRIIARIHPAAEDDDDSGEWVATNHLRPGAVVSAGARANGWHGFDNIGERVDKGEFGNPPARGGWLYRCDGMPRQMGCGAELITTRRLARVGVKSSGWLVTYGLEPKPGMPGRFDDPSQWEEDHDIVLTFCPSCAAVVQGKEKS